eukprot:TRINITY_DN8897_c0_g1_i1.p1 TRINITY_DN8897_c0_g1~~TRINITY_DN8897_c0_g1_i1.p1  ORF type:complete len:301 (-),score=54.24 TRINITY_DN8897_c0_g1_i1:61-963(-)
MVEQPKIRVTALNIYPVKGCRGIPLEQVRITETGFEHDREWMIATAPSNPTEQPRFLTQRQIPKISLIQVSLTTHQGYLAVTTPNNSPLLISLERDPSKPKLEAGIWKDTVLVQDEGEEAANYISTFLNKKCRLLRAGVGYKRLISDKYTIKEADNLVSLSDGYPFLITNVKSLELLNTKLPSPIKMNRFRPNIVIDGDVLPFDERTWNTIRIGEHLLHIVKPCSRCKVTTVVQEEGAVGDGEPLKTLKSLNPGSAQGTVYFGENIIHQQTSYEGLIRVGDPLLLVDRREQRHELLAEAP